MQKHPSLRSTILFIVLIVVLPFLMIALKSIQQLLTQATGTKANIVVDVNLTLEPIIPFWSSFAQGGEESSNMIAPIVSQIKTLHPRYIRIDHLYDHYNVVGRDTQGTLTFNFASLDGVVGSIMQTGALPFLSLSYMPPAIAKNGDITQTPLNWNEWAAVVSATITHYSGKSGLNISNVYYEVWNEPDLFGGWHTYGDKNYLTLYQYAVLGAENAKNTNPFKIGGPDTTQLYEDWITTLAQYVTRNNLRLDFFSWHRYSNNPTQYAKDVSQVTGWLFPYPQLVSKPRIISEWGFDPEINAGYDGTFAAAHAIAVVRQAINGYEQLFSFELVDGPDPAGHEYWGRWGLLTHPTFGQHQKPRFAAMQLLSSLSGQRLLVSGEGTWVTALATKDNGSIKILLVNYDQSNLHTEQVPITITNLISGQYQFKSTRLSQNSTSEIASITNGRFATQVIMPTNSVVLLELTAPANPFLGN